MFKISQWEHENPEYYQQFGLPSHCAIDFPAANGTPVKAVKSGIVTNVHTNPNTSNYGIHVRLLHENGHRTIYAHLQSVNVTVNQQVISGQTIGLSNNTGLSTGPHLHLELRKDNDPYTDPNGNVWPYGLRPVWPSLVNLYQSWLNQNSITGYLYSPGLIKNMSGDYARVYGTLNIRATPQSNGQLLGQVTSHTVVKILSGLIGGYYQVMSPVDIPVGGGYIYNGPSVTFKPIIESPADDWRWPTVKGMIDSLNIGVKFKSHGINPDYYNSYTQHSFLPIRLFFSANNYQSPHTLYYDTWRGQIQNFYNRGARDFELFNEPNIEGNGVFWTNGTEYANYMRQICQWIISDFPQARIWFTAMSPGLPFTNQYTWTDAAWPILSPYCYGFCLHAYSGNNDNVQTAVSEIVNQIDVTRQRYNLQKPLFLSECSVNRGQSYYQKAQVYKQLEAILSQKAGIRGVSYFISDWYTPPPDQQDHGESWYNTSLPQHYISLP